MLNNHIAVHPLLTPCFALLEEWMRTCDTNHEICRVDRDSRNTSIVRTRLVDVEVEDPASVRVIRTVPQEQPYIYAALSRCWGSVPGVTACANNIAVHETGIPVDTLPQTFQDAIAVCRGIGIRHIWIDSLCIIQDDTEDWEVESAKMRHIFQNAYLTIAAAAASSDLEGFSSPRHPRHVRAPEIQPWERYSWVCEPYRGMVITNYETFPFTDVEAGPLSRRAWVLQERYLAHRTVFFTEYGLCWSCPQGTIDESGYTYRETTSLRADLQQSMLRYDHTSNEREVKGLTLCSDLTRQKWPYHGWYRMATLYSRCSITKITDRLPALSGIVSLIASHTNEEYYAGLWENGIIEGLAWRAGNVHDYQPANQSKEYIVPTWSWLAPLTHIGFVSLEDMTIRATVENVHVNLRGLNIYGEITSGSLDLTGPMPSVTKVKSVSTQNDGFVEFRVDDTYCTMLALFDFRSKPEYWTFELVILAHQTKLHQSDCRGICYRTTCGSTSSRLLGIMNCKGLARSHFMHADHQSQ